MPKLTIDEQEISVDEGLTVIQACELLGIEVPRFCYHQRLAIAGNCRMCLVEMDKSAKPIASCAMPVAEGMVIRTNTPMVQKAREGVMEFLLINHPLDCPICDQGGECDLQDQAMSYGRDRNRFHENKRAVKDKEIGPLVKTTMTRCIHCTRCVRFLQDVVGVSDLGATGRGEDMEIDTYVEKALTSELSGNIIDLCPVGALTSKPYAFEARSWELRKTETIDVLDAVGSNIRMDSRGSEIKRILPRLNESVNEEWISDKTRFACDGLSQRRLDRPWVRDDDGNLVECSWGKAFSVINDRLTELHGARVAAIVGDLADCESMFALRELMSKLGSPNIDCRQDGAKLEAKSRSGYLFNSSFAGIEEADFILLVGADPRWEAPVLNARIRKRYLSGQLRVAVIGSLPERENGLTYPFMNFGNDPVILQKIIQGDHELSRCFAEAKTPMIIVGQAALSRNDGSSILSAAREVAESFGMVRDDWNGFNVLHNAAARVGGLDLGLVPGPGGLDVKGILSGAETGEVDLVYLLGADEFDVTKLKDCFVIYQGTHGDSGANSANVILPGAAYSEKDGTYVNMEGRAQRANRASFPPGEAREDWAIIRALSSALGKPLPFNTLLDLRVAMAADCPGVARLDEVGVSDWGVFGVSGSIDSEPLVIPVRDFYLTDPISRASATMRLCSDMKLAGDGSLSVTGTHG